MLLAMALVALATLAMACLPLPPTLNSLGLLHQAPQDDYYAWLLLAAIQGELQQENAGGGEEER
jgi:hypothetical protein